jgi:hypothetical protein
MPGAFDGKDIKIRTGRVNDLISLLESTYKRLTEEMITATEAGKIQKARVMARINLELEALGVDVDAWVREEIPQYYLDGANTAIQDLRAQGADVSARTNFAVINKEAIAALTDEVALNFAQAIRGVGRSANNLLSDVLKQQLNYIIAEGKLTGDTRKMISNNLKQKLQDNGLTALTDRSGRQWTLDNYTRMLARTKAVEARNQGLTNRMLGYGYDLVQVTNHRSEHPACAFWEGKILSLTGKTEGYPTLQQAIEAGLFHPNCQHAINVFHPELAAITKAYDNPFNYRDAESMNGSTPAAKTTAKSGGRVQDSTVFHGTGAQSLPPGNNMVGNAFYVARDAKTAQVFGKTTDSTLRIRQGELLQIPDQAHYNRFVQEALGAYPGVDPQKAIPDYARKLGYKAVEISPDFDELGGIAVLDKSILR